jgi:hypothetical protein
MEGIHASLPLPFWSMSAIAILQQASWAFGASRSMKIGVGKRLSP